ncbi:MAG: hypothetical protein GY801_08720, partial [bacterium]|nr:hypothetical protein [bacterium]
MCKNLWQLVLFLILSLAVFFVNPADVIHAETRLQPDTIISGSVEITTDGETWTAFNQDGALKAGDSIRTGEGSAVSLKAEDGSTLYLEEQTQLTIAELTFSAIDRARIFRFYLERGILTVKVGNVESKASAFDVTTRSVLVRLHQQSAGDMETRARIIANPLTTSQLNATLLASASDTRGLLIAKLLPPIGSTGSTGASEDPFASKVQPLSGKFDVEQLNNEKTLVEITVGSGVTFTMTLPGQTITLTIDQGNISLTSDQPLPANMVFETSGGNNSVILTNPNQDPSMNPEFMVGDHT